MKVYLDNAATTSLDEEVFEAMKPYMLTHYGNPSSVHSHGRLVRTGIEKARKQIADLLSTSPGEIFFTSGGTEADNAIIRCSVDTYGLKHAITSRIEHHAVLHTLRNLEQLGKIQLNYVNVDGDGCIDYDHLNELLANNSQSLVSLMHANNEIGNITDIERVGFICKEHNAIFHSDTVQTMGHYQHNLAELPINSAVGSGHKFHGPKGAGFMYIDKQNRIHPFIHGGGQERSMRGGTENVYGIIGTAKALEIAYRGMESHQNYIQSLKDRMISQLRISIPDIHFNGDSEDSAKSLYTVLNLCLPVSEDNDMLLFNLDINEISASAGSACSSGASKGSHVIAELDRDDNRAALRFSFSKFNTFEEIDYAVEKLAAFYQVEV